MHARYSLIAIALVLAIPAAAAADHCAARSGSHVAPLVELYTSEGCSSCPPADRWLSQRFHDGNANFLAFHVDYWDAIGWPDRFASPLYSQRQRQRVAATGGDTVYTPQVMVGDEVRASWRSDAGFKRVIDDARKPAQVALALRLQPSDGDIRVQLGAARAGGAGQAAQLWLAQYEDDQTSKVRAGENRGATLHHDRVVLHLWGPWPLAQEPLSRVQRVQAASGAWGLTAFVQDARGRTLQSLDLPAQACLAGRRAQ